MPQARGSQATFNIYDEDSGSYGQDPAVPSAEKLYLKSCGLAVSQTKLKTETLTGTRTKNKPDNGNVDATGPLAAELGSESIGKLLKHTFGQAVTTGAGPYTHTYSIGDLPTGFVVEKDFGSNISGAGRVEKFNGCRVASMELDVPQEGYAQVTFNVQAANSSNETAALDATPTDYGHTSFSAFAMATIEEGGAAIAIVKSCKFTLNNDLDTDSYVLGSGGVRSDLPEGETLVDVELVALFDSAALLTKAENSTQTSLRVVFSRGSGDGSAGNEYAEFDCQAMDYERTSAGIDGPKGLMVNMKATGYTANALRAVLKNAVAIV